MGGPGTRKTQVIDTVTNTLEEWGQANKLVKGAYTGIAASQISGKTIHGLMKAGIQMYCTISACWQKLLQDFW